MNINSKILITGAKKSVGRVIIDFLKKRRYKNIYSDKNFDINNFQDTKKNILKIKPEFIFCLSGLSGSIKYNIENPYLLMNDNLKSTLNLLNSLHGVKIKKLVYLSSSCVYPKKFSKPFKPENILQSKLEKTNESYALSKLACMKLIENYSNLMNFKSISVIPSTIYGPYDNFDINNSHVVSALIRKIAIAKKDGLEHINLFGTGKPIRDFIYIEDLVNSLIFIMKKNIQQQIVNVSDPQKILSIKELSGVIKNILKYNGKIYFKNPSLDGVKIKILDSSYLNKLGFNKFSSLDKSLKKTYNWYMKNIHEH